VRLDKSSLKAAGDKITITATVENKR